MCAGVAGGSTFVPSRCGSPAEIWHKLSSDLESHRHILLLKLLFSPWVSGIDCCRVRNIWLRRQPRLQRASMHESARAGIGLDICFETMTPDIGLRASGLYERFRSMLLRITQQHEGALTVIAIDGHLVADGVAELGRLCRA